MHKKQIRKSGVYWLVIAGLSLVLFWQGKHIEKRQALSSVLANLHEKELMDLDLNHPFYVPMEFSQELAFYVDDDQFSKDRKAIKSICADYEHYLKLIPGYPQKQRLSENEQTNLVRKSRDTEEALLQIFDQNPRIKSLIDSFLIQPVSVLNSYWHIPYIKKQNRQHFTLHMRLLQWNIALLEQELLYHCLELNKVPDHLFPDEIYAIVEPDLIGPAQVNIPWKFYLNFATYSSESRHVVFNDGRQTMLPVRAGIAMDSVEAIPGQELTASYHLKFGQGDIGFIHYPDSNQYRILYPNPYPVVKKFNLHHD